MDEQKKVPQVTGDSYGANFIGGTQHITGQGNVFGGKDVTVHVSGTAIGADNAAKLQELFTALQKQIEAANVPEADKADAAEATQMLKSEVEAVAKDPAHKPNRITMNGMVAAFKKLGAPVFGAAMAVIGFPALGAAVNQFAQALPDGQ